MGRQGGRQVRQGVPLSPGIVSVLFIILLTGIAGIVAMVGRTLGFEAFQEHKHLGQPHQTLPTIHHRPGNAGIAAAAAAAYGKDGGGGGGGSARKRGEGTWGANYVQTAGGKGARGGAFRDTRRITPSTGDSGAALAAITSSTSSTTAASSSASSSHPGCPVTSDERTVNLSRKPSVGGFVTRYTKELGYHHMAMIEPLPNGGAGFLFYFYFFPNRAHLPWVTADLTVRPESVRLRASDSPGGGVSTDHFSLYNC